MRCAYCHHPLEGNAKRCPSCGAYRDGGFPFLDVSAQHDSQGS
jgi:hypothetical protein